MGSPIHLTMLNFMVGGGYEGQMGHHLEWGIHHLDLKGQLFGKAVEHLSLIEAQKIRQAADQREMKIHTLSTCLFDQDIEAGETAFREQDFPALERVLDIADILQPYQIRLLVAKTSRRPDILDSSRYLEEVHPWVVPMYGEAVDRICNRGFRIALENEVGSCLFARPEEIIRFFDAMNRGDRVGFIWDIQNLWQMGTFPSLAVYENLKPLISMIHLKGGRSEIPGGPLVWKSNLEDASWPVLEIVRQVIADGVSPVICLNPSHGKTPENYNLDTKRDVYFLRRHLKEVV